jgi:hypothetical protein
VCARVVDDRRVAASALTHDGVQLRVVAAVHLGYRLDAITVVEPVVPTHPTTRWAICLGHDVLPFRSAGEPVAAGITRPPECESEDNVARSPVTRRA